MNKNQAHKIKTNRIEMYLHLSNGFSNPVYDLLMIVQINYKIKQANSCKFLISEIILHHNVKLDFKQ